MADYIDRDKLLDAVFELPPKMDAQGYGWIARGGLYQLIRDFQSADVAPVVHGKWKQTGGKYSRHKTIDRRILTCSVCGNVLYMEGVNAGRGDANYCPNCGADMRGEP